MNAPSARLNPFPGLRPYTQEEDYLFFGREEQTLELLQRLGTSRFVAVVGTSGSGKSSLVRCGLLSELLGGRLLEAGAAWEIAVAHPGGNPLALLTDALLESDLYDRQAEHVRENLLATLSRSHFGLVEAVKQAGLPTGTNFLLVVDQFEEIFRFHEAGQRQQEVANEFVSLLLEAATQKEVPIYVVLTMRSDFIGECGQFEGLAEMVNRGEFLIPRLTREQYKRVIEGPIKVAGGQIAPRLLQRLLNDLGQQADQLPCLQHALMRTWNVWAAKDDAEALDLDDYQRVGKMSQALSLHADEIYASLASDCQRELCRGIFQALTVEESNSRGIRRPQRLSRLCQIVQVPAEELLPIIDAYRQRGVTFLTPAPEVELTERTIIDISHESLMRVWSRLRRWVEEEAQAVGIYRRLSESAELYKQGGAGLYRDPELSIALAWRESKRPNQAWAERYHPGFAQAMAFLDASQQAHVAEEQEHEAARQRELGQARILAEFERQRAETKTHAARRLRVMLAGTAIVAIFALAASLVAVNFWSAAEMAKSAAERSEQSAKRSALAAQTEADRASRQETAAKEARRDAEGNLARARGAIDDYLIKISESQLLSTPGLQPLRAELLASASQFYEDILKKDPDNPDLQAGLAAAFFRVGFVRFETGEVDQSALALERAAEFYAKALAAQPANTELKHGLANCWFTLAAVFLNIDPTRSNDNAKRAAQIWEELLQGGSKDLRFHKELARAYNVIGINYSQANRPEEAFLAYQRSLSIRLSLISEHPDDVQLVHGLGESFNNLVMQVTDPKLRVQMHLRSIEYAERAHKLSPQNVEYASDLTGFYTTTAAVLALQGRHAEAKELHLRNLSHLGKFIRGNPRIPLIRALVPMTILQLGRSASRNVEATTYVQLIQDCAKLSTELPKETPEDHLIDAETQSRAAAWLPTVWRQGAPRALTPAETVELRALRDRGIEALRLAIAAGFKDVARLEQDADLNSLRQDTRFNQFVAQLKSAGGAAAAVAQPATERAASDAELAQINQDRASGYQAFGVIETDLNRTDQAAQSLDQALALRQTLAQAAPENRELAADLAGVRDALARLYWETGQLAKARDLFRERIEQLQQRIEGGFAAPETGDPAGTVSATVGATRELAALERQFGDSLADACLWDEAAPHYIQAQKWSLKLKAAERTKLGVDQSDGNAVYEAIVSPMLALLGDTDSTYSAACEQALAKYSPTSDPEHAARAARLCALKPGAVADLAPVLALTERAQYSWHAYSRALGLYRAGKFEEAIVLIDDAVSKQQIVGLGVEDFVLAMAHFQAGRKEQARTILEQANRRSPRNMSPWTYETHNMLEVDWLVLRREANELIHGGPYGLDDRRRRGQAYAQLKDYEQAQAELAAVIEASPDDPLSRFVQARMFAEQGRTQQATQALDQARQVLFAKSPGSAAEIELWRTCAETCRLLERHDDACQAWQQAVAAQSQRVIQQPQLSTGRWLLVRLNEELIKSLQAAGREADAVAARDELQALHAAFGLPPILRAAVDVLADSGQWTTSSDASLAAIDRLIAATPKSTAAGDPVGLYLRGRLHQRRAEVLQNDGRSESDVNVEIATARGQFEQLLGVDPQNAEAATALADLLLSRSAVTWTTLEPTTLSSRAGTKLTRQADGSILASGPSPNRETYTVVARPSVPTIAAVRLETLPHPSFSRGGAGRDRNGWFFLTEFTVAAAPPGERPAKDPLPLKLTRAVASFHRTMENGNQYPIQNAIDGQPAAWDPWPEVYRRLEAVFAVQPDAAQMSDSPLVIQLTSNGSTGTRPTLGRFRLSVTSDAAGFGQEQRRLAARQLSDPWAKLGVAYALSGQAAQGAEALAKGFDRTSDTAAKARLIQAVASDAEVLQEFLKIRPNEPLLLAEMAKLYALRGEHDQAAAARNRARTLFDEHLATDPENTSLMHGLADLVLESAGPKWTVLTPMEMQSTGGENLAVERDGSIFVSGADPQRAVYTLKFQSELPALTAIRLEALPDARLPSGGAGRYPGNGNFHLGEMTAAIVPGQPNGQPVRIEIASAMASDQGSTQVGATRVIDGDPATYWDTHPRHLQAHWMICGLSTPMAIDGQELRITLDSGISNWGQHGLGHFRLSASDSAGAYQREEQRLASLKLTDPWAKLGAAYVLAGDTERAVDLLVKSGEKAGIAAWLESDFSFDDVFDLLESTHPGLYAKYLPTAANAAAERGQTDQARKLYERLARLQPDNELWKERTDQLQPGVRAVWNFDKGPGSWGAANHCQLAVQDGVLTARTTGSDPNFSSPVSGSEGGKVLVLRYRTEREFQMQIFWADSTGGFSEARHLDYPIPESAGQWREISLPFLCQGTLQSLRLDANTAAAHPVEIDSIVLRHLEPAEFQPLANEFAIKPELARLNEAIDTDPTNPAPHYARGTYLTRLGRWRQAAEDFEEEQKLNPVDRLTWFRAGICLVLAGDEEAFSQHCRAMLVQFKDTTDDQIADSVCKTCLLHPGAVELSELPAQNLRDATADTEHENIRHWFVAGCALISYREGNDDEALAWIAKHPNLTGQSGALALVVRAMAEQRLGRADGARASLAQAETLIPAVLRTLGTEAYTGPLPVQSAAVTHDWLAAEVLRREAEKLIGPLDKPAGRQ